MSSFWDAFIVAVEEFLRLLFAPVEAFVETFGNTLVDLVVSTPFPNRVFGPPTNDPWVAIYDYYWSAIMPLSLSLYGLMIGLVIFLESTSYLFGSYHRSKLTKRAFTGLLGLLSWWWIAALSLRFVDALSGFIVPDLSEITLLESASFTALGLLGVILASTVDLTLFVLIALIYTVRQLAIYLFVLLMPLLIVFWIPGVGPFRLMSRFMTRLSGFYVPLLFMTLPVALLFRLGGLLGESLSLSLGGVGAWLVGLLIPFAALFSPIVLFWQAGALFFLADRTSTHVSADRGRERFSRMQETTETVAHSGRNFRRGFSTRPAVNRDNQHLLDSSQSRAHTAGTRANVVGTRLHQTGGRLRETFSAHLSRRRGRSDGSTDGKATPDGESSGKPTEQRRIDDFQNLRSRGSGAGSDRSADDTAESQEDRPRYIH